MIVFDGELTGKCKKFVLRKFSNLAGLICIITFSLVSFLVFGIAKTFGMSIIWIYIAFAVVATLLTFLLPPYKQDQKTFMPQKVYVDLKDEMLVCKCEQKEQIHSIDSVYRVIDYGEWYHFKFNFGERDRFFVCQKNLLTEGSIEEFEALFEDVLIRKA